MSLGLKIKQMRKSLGLSQAKFAETVDISLGMIKKYETGVNEMGSAPLQKMLAVPDCFQFTLWLLTGQTASIAGQISPDNYPPTNSETDAEKYLQEVYISQSNNALKSMDQLEWLSTRDNIEYSDISNVILKQVQPTINLMAIEQAKLLKGK
jgi:transcriptional regulator with XRE-family HTH domain